MQRSPHYRPVIRRGKGDRHHKGWRGHGQSGKYEEEKGVPFRNEKKIELPELDYEITEKDDDFTPEWMRNSTEQSKTNSKKGKEHKGKEPKDKKHKENKKHKEHKEHNKKNKNNSLTYVSRMHNAWLTWQNSQRIRNRKSFSKRNVTHHICT